MSKEDHPLAFFTLEELIEEVQLRNDHGVVFLIKVMEPGKVEAIIGVDEGTSGSNEINRYYWGDLAKLSTLTEIMADHLKSVVACQVQMCGPCCCAYEVDEDEDS